MVEATQAVGRSRGSYLASQLHRLTARRGKKRVAVAVAHSMRFIIYHFIRRGTAYVDLGINYLDERKPESVKAQSVKRLERLGFKVTLEPTTQAA